MSDHDSPLVAVITGASSGIGAATARALTLHGYRVVLLARRTDRLQQLADELTDAAVAIAADVTDRDALVVAAEQVRHDLGRVDVLVNNAGVMLLGPFGSEQREEARRMVEVNLLGAMTATEVFLPHCLSSATAAATWSTSPPSPAAPPAPATPPTPPPNGA